MKKLLSLFCSICALCCLSCSDDDDKDLTMFDLEGSYLIDNIDGDKSPFADGISMIELEAKNDYTGYISSSNVWCGIQASYSYCKLDGRRVSWTERYTMNGKKHEDDYYIDFKSSSKLIACDKYGNKFTISCKKSALQQ